MYLIFYWEFSFGRYVMLKITSDTVHNTWMKYYGDSYLEHKRYDADFTS